MCMTGDSYGLWPKQMKTYLMGLLNHLIFLKLRTPKLPARWKQRCRSIISHALYSGQSQKPTAQVGSGRINRGNFKLKEQKAKLCRKTRVATRRREVWSIKDTKEGGATMRHR